MNRRIDTIRVAEFLARKFSIYTTDPKRLAKFARDALGSETKFTPYESLLKESLERVASW